MVTFTKDYSILITRFFAGSVGKNNLCKHLLTTLLCGVSMRGLSLVVEPLPPSAQLCIYVERMTLHENTFHVLQNNCI